MDNYTDIETQVNQIIEKSMIDLRNKINKAIIKHETKLVKEYTKKIKNVEKPRKKDDDRTTNNKKKIPLSYHDKRKDDSESESDR